MLSCTVQGEEVGLVPHCTAEVLDILLEAMYVAWLCLLLQWLLVAMVPVRPISEIAKEPLSTSQYACLVTRYFGSVSRVHDKMQNDNMSIHKCCSLLRLAVSCCLCHLMLLSTLAGSAGCRMSNCKSCVCRDYFLLSTAVICLRGVPWTQMLWKNGLPPTAASL